MSPAVDDLDQWFKETAHQFESLLAVTDRAQNALIGGAAAMQDVAHLLRTTGEDGRRWLRDHSCPDGELGDRLERLFDRYGEMATRFGKDGGHRSGKGIAELTRDLGSLSGDLAILIADVQEQLGGT